MKTACIIMSAVVPTIGHKYLIDWAYHYCNNAQIDRLAVLVCGIPGEPVDLHTRTLTLIMATNPQVDYGYTRLSTEAIMFAPTTLPEHPDPTLDYDEKFWQLWKEFIEGQVGKVDVYIGSEKWGKIMASVLGAEFIPCDPYRDIVRTKGTSVRENPIERFNEILPEIQPMFRKTLTIFGAESTGKTTLAKSLAYGPWPYEGHYVHEWARPYLEVTDPETTEAKMKTIAFGQLAAEQTVAEMRGKPFIYRDTDLLSTIGFYRLYYEQEPSWLVDMWKSSKADLYIFTQSNIPFTPDILRYGGDKREAPDSFWKAILDDYKVPCHILQSVLPTDRWAEVQAVASALFKSHPAWSYERKGNT